MEKRAKGIALKTTMEHDTSEEEENHEHDETLSLLTRKFSKFLRKKNRDRTQQERGILNPMIQTLLITLALDVVNQVI